MTTRSEEDAVLYFRHKYAAEIKTKDTEIEQLRVALDALVKDILDYERVNNLSPNPGRKYCWQSVEDAIAILNAANAKTTKTSSMPKWDAMTDAQRRHCEFMGFDPDNPDVPLD